MTRIPYHLTLPRKLAEPKELTENILRSINIGQRYWEARVSDLSPEQMEAIYPYLSRFYEGLLSGVGLVLWGANGVGKSHIAALLCKEACRKYGVYTYFVSAVDLRLAFMNPKISSCGEDSDEGGTPLLERATHTRLLVIDDLGKEYLADSGYVHSQLNALLRHRAKHKLTTVVTANSHPTDLVSDYGLSLVEALIESCFPVFIKGDNIRRIKAKTLDTLIDTALGDNNEKNNIS